MYAIVCINGQQFKVEEGKKLFVHHIQNAEAGQTVEFDNVLLVDNEGNIAVGTPTWWYTMAPAVKSFLADHDFSGKQVILFQTHGGWPGHTLKDMEKACRGASFGPSLAVQFDSTGGSKLVTAAQDIDDWIEEVKAVHRSSFVEGDSL